MYIGFGIKNGAESAKTTARVIVSTLLSEVGLIVIRASAQIVGGEFVAHAQLVHKYVIIVEQWLVQSTTSL